MSAYLESDVGLLDGALFFRSNLDDESGYYLTEESELSRRLRLTSGAIKNLLKTGTSLDLASTPVKASERRQMADLLRVCFEEVRRHFPMHRLAPDLALVERLTAVWEAQGLLPTHFDGITARLSIPEYRLDAFVREMRLEAGAPEFITAQKNYRRKFTKNHAGLLKNLASISKDCSRILVNRIDFSYQKPALWPDDTRSPVTLEEAVLHRRQILSWVKKQYTVVGYSWRFEYGLLKGYHYHFLFLLDGSSHQQSVSINRHIGRQWNGPVTEGKGLHWNCNARDYKFRGVGMLDHRDTPKIRIFLEKVVPYLTKTEEVIEFAPPDGTRTFGRSVTRQRHGNKAGRPRGQKPLRRGS